MNHDRIDAIRRRLGLTGHQLGLLIGVDGSTVYRWGAGDPRGGPTQLAQVILLALEDVASRRPDAGSWVLGLVTTRGLGYALHALLQESYTLAQGLQASTDMRTSELDPDKTIAAILAANGSITEAAKALGKDRTTVVRFVKTHGLRPRLAAELRRRGLPVHFPVDEPARPAPARRPRKAPRKPGR